MNKYDYSLERRLKELDNNLHTRFTNTVFALQQILSNYQLIFPQFTDHTELHSLNIIEFCNHLIGDQIDKLNADEIYCILMGCYFHDTGMGISHKDFEEFSKQIDFGNYFETHSREDYPEIVRNFHNEYSGLFIKKEDIIEGSSELFRKLAINNMKPDKKGRILYKRYGNVRKEYVAEQKELKKKQKALKAKK